MTSNTEAEAIFVNNDGSGPIDVDNPSVKAGLGNSNGKNNKHPAKYKARKNLIPSSTKHKGKTFNPKLIPIKSLVEAQPTTDLQSTLFALANNNLVSMITLKHKELGLAKLKSEDDYVAISIRFDPPLFYPKELRTDQATIDEEIGWKNDIATCKKKLGLRLINQTERNVKSMDKENQKRILREMIKLGTLMAQREKIFHDLTDSSANDDVLAKAAVINFFKSLPWLDKLIPKEERDSLRILFKGSDEDTMKIVKEVCTESGDNNDKWESLIHTASRNYKRTSVYNARINNNNNNNNTIIGDNTTGENNNNGNNNNNETAETTAAMLPPPPTDAQMGSRWNGNSILPKTNQLRLSPFELFLELEKSAQQEYLGERTYVHLVNMLNDGDDSLEDENKIFEADNLLSDHLMIWMMKIFPDLLTKPYQLSLLQSRQDRADAALRGKLKSDTSHTLAAGIEERIEKDDEHIKMGKSKFKSLVHSEALKLEKQRKRKNSSWGDDTASDDNTKNGNNGSPNKRQKVRFNKQKNKQIPKKNNSNVNNPYVKKNTQRKGQPKSPKNTSGKHDYRPGGKKQHQFHRNDNNNQKGQGRGRGDNGQKGRNKR
jgi:hypothetical protein